ncbi:hypothetical protein A2V61_01645 [Candidatus Woesebacteria bacterium RBG_19FT_COMBO_47_8]|uniref:Carrier domain-containing protein n=1 Tax=Candidatus Woesebacteria bacterium RBG_13_46_13 TaxID=1802479 RepID=A0A1F7X3E6_9BACT|nr:MAG: hypothetical protein A2Y68_03210 [Candidatus Woesebacteria bacterium RBG_13_46_13]OGM17620.1 MAG: hypothetical protein A2V61_01645 [Candidatus Woesebacteria bacterium RBG_19FT_COMBO_47_8]HJX59571.1 hypothetical protein [Patescibacteria group bacterium]
MKEEKLKEFIKGKIADTIGVEVEDIEDTDTFSEELHMSATDFTDFLNTLGGLGIDAQSLELSPALSVEELVETVSSHVAE